MKRITVQENEVAILTKNETIVACLGPGKHWIGFGHLAHIYNRYADFAIKQNVDILLSQTDFEQYIEMVTVPDGHITLHLEHDRLVRVLQTGRYLLWKIENKNRFECYNTTDIAIPAALNKALLQNAMLSPYLRSYKVEPYEKGLLFVNGSYEGILAAGTYTWFVNATTIQITKADMRQSLLELNGQEILTKDKAQLRINCTLRYQIVDVALALKEHKEYEKQLYTLFQLALRAYIGQMTLDELMENKNQINELVLAELKEKAIKLGIDIADCGVKDIILPGDMKDIMNQVLIAEKRAQANIIMRREETASTRSLLNTAKLMEDNAMLMRLKEMEYVEKIADKINTISLSSNGQILDQLKQLFIK